MKAYPELFDHIVKCIMEKDFKVEATAEDTTFLVQPSVPGTFLRRRVKVRLLVNAARKGMASINSPGPKGKGEYFEGNFTLR